MSGIAWGDVGTWVGAAATFAAVAYTLWHERWFDRRQRPKLMLTFDQQWDIRTQDRTVGLPPEARSRWLRVRVENASGRKAAKNCRAYLAHVSWVCPDGRLLEILYNDVRPLPWMHDEPGHVGSRDLLPGIPHWVDVAHTRSDQGSLVTSAVPRWGIESPGGAYVFVVKLAAEDADPVEIKLVVRWNGEWESLDCTLAAQ